jgi:hypothetical protein
MWWSSLGTSDGPLVSTHRTTQFALSVWKLSAYDMESLIVHQRELRVWEYHVPCTLNILKKHVVSAKTAYLLYSLQTHHTLPMAISCLIPPSFLHTRSCYVLFHLSSSLISHEIFATGRRTTNQSIHISLRCRLDAFYDKKH